MTKQARLYGTSLYDLSLEESESKEILDQMEQVRALFQENPDYVGLLSEPAVALGDRLKMIDEAFSGQAHKYLVNFLKLLCERGLLREFSGCTEEFERRYDADNGITRAQVTSAVALTQSQQDALQERLEKLSGKQVRMRFAIDPRVVAGLRVEMDGRELDGTVQGRMTGIARKLEQVTL